MASDSRCDNVDVYSLQQTQLSVSPFNDDDPEVIEGVATEESQDLFQTQSTSGCVDAEQDISKSMCVEGVVDFLRGKGIPQKYCDVFNGKTLS